MANKIKLVVIVGPTASGKSDLGIKIAKKINGEIISADSRQVYKDMDIGTGKVLKDRFKNYDLRIKNLYFSYGIRHHLIDVFSPKKQFTADDFKRFGEKAIQDINNRGKIPIIVGGTGFYIDVLLDQISVAGVSPNPVIRKNLEKLSVEKLFTKLNKMDPERAKTIDPNNKRRLIRALEIILISGNPVPRLNTKYMIHDTKYQVLWIGLKPDKEKLAKKIKRRLNDRLSHGMVKEIKNLHKKGLTWKRLDDFGLEYRWVSKWLKRSKLKIPDSRFKNSDEYQNLLREIIKYSKRQMTWFKRNKDIHWIETGNEAPILVKNFFKA